MSETVKKTMKLDPDQFTVDENGKVTINDNKLAELIKAQSDDVNEAGSVGVSVEIGISVGAQ